MSLLTTVGTDHIRFDGTGNQHWNVPLSHIGGLPIAVIDRAKSAQLMIDVALRRRNSALPPLIITSANGQVLSQCAGQPAIHRLFLQTDLIQADGMSLVFASHLFRSKPLPERICTTDFFHDVVLAGQHRGARMYLLGGTQAVIDEAARRLRSAYPALNIVGHASGYMRCKDEESRIVDAINAARPDILWVGLGVPLEQDFAVRNRHRLRGVGLIKTAGGLFDVLSGQKPRAPSWMRHAGMEWIYRWYLEPRRLARRYLTTNPHALYLLLTRTGA